VKYQPAAADWRQRRLHSDAASSFIVVDRPLRRPGVRERSDRRQDSTVNRFLDRAIVNRRIVDKNLPCIFMLPTRLLSGFVLHAGRLSCFRRQDAE
jgi:hypothetical protein